jgi:hypothetical protein
MYIVSYLIPHKKISGENVSIRTSSFNKKYVYRCMDKSEEPCLSTEDNAQDFKHLTMPVFAVTAFSSGSS